MLLKQEVVEAIRSGTVTLQFRRWTRPTVRAGGTLKTRRGLIRIGAITDMQPQDVTLADANRAGFADLAAFRRWLDSMKQGPLFQRIEVSWLRDGDA